MALTRSTCESTSHRDRIKRIVTHRHFLRALLLAILILPGHLRAQEGDQPKPDATKAEKSAPEAGQIAEAADGPMAFMRALEEKLEATAAQVLPCVVGLQIGGRSGSGALISEDGWIATAGHVSGEVPGSRCTVLMPDGQAFYGKTYGFFEGYDYGLVKIDPPKRGERAPFPFVEMGDSDLMAQGEWVLAMGHPLGFEAGRPPVVRVGRVRDPENRSGMMVIDAPLISGDSGGPVFDADGKLIAINQSVSIANAQINNVTPISGFKVILPDLKRNRVYTASEGIGPAGEIVRTISEDDQALLDEAKALAEEGKFADALDKLSALTESESPLPEILLTAARISASEIRSYGRRRSERQARNAAANRGREFVERAIAEGFNDILTLRNDDALRVLNMSPSYRNMLDALEESVTLPAFAIVVGVGDDGEVQIDSVEANSEADRAGLEVGDVLIKLDESSTPDLLSYANAVAKLDLYSSIRISVLRDGKTLHFDYMAAPAARSKKPVRRDPVREDKFDVALLKTWDTYADQLSPAVFAVVQRRARDRVAYATAIDEGGYLITKASQILSGQLWVRDDDGVEYEASVVDTDAATDLALLKVDLHLDAVVDFGGLERSANTDAEGEPSAPAIGMQLAAFVASLDDMGDALTWGAVCVVAYDSNSTPAVDPQGAFMGISFDRGNKEPGALLTDITPESPAESTGLLIGDYILEVDGVKVPTGSGIVPMIAEYQPNDVIELLIKRGDEELTLKLTLAMRAEVENKDSAYIGMEVRDVMQSVRVASIVKHRAADRAGIWEGDTILTINGKDVPNKKAFEAIFKELTVGSLAIVALERDGMKINVMLTVSDVSERPLTEADDNRERMKGPINLRWRKFGTVIHHDGIIDPTQTGAPVIDTNGRIVGLNIARTDRTRSFAMPSDRVAETVRALLAEAETSEATGNAKSE